MFSCRAVSPQSIYRCVEARSLEVNFLQIIELSGGVVNEIETFERVSSFSSCVVKCFADSMGYFIRLCPDVKAPAVPGRCCEPHDPQKLGPMRARLPQSRNSILFRPALITKFQSS